MAIITLCGSARFEPLFHAWNEALTLAGHVVLGLSVYPSQKLEREWYTAEEKVLLDRAHFAKIAVADTVVFLNPLGYIGPSTAKEVQYAIDLGKSVRFLEFHHVGVPLADNPVPGSVLAQVVEAFGLTGKVVEVKTIGVGSNPYELLWDAGLELANELNRRVVHAGTRMLYAAAAHSVKWAEPLGIGAADTAESRDRAQGMPRQPEWKAEVDDKRVRLSFEVRSRDTGRLMAERLLKVVTDESSARLVKEAL